MLVYKSLYLIITILVFKNSCVNGSNQLHIGGIFPIGGKGGWQGGQGKAFKANLYDFGIRHKTCGESRASYAKPAIYLFISFITSFIT